MNEGLILEMLILAENGSLKRSDLARLWEEAYSDGYEDGEEGL